MQCVQKKRHNNEAGRKDRSDHQSAICQVMHLSSYSHVHPVSQSDPSVIDWAVRGKLIVSAGVWMTVWPQLSAPLQQDSPTAPKQSDNSPSSSFCLGDASSSKIRVESMRHSSPKVRCITSSKQRPEMDENYKMTVFIANIKPKFVETSPRRLWDSIEVISSKGVTWIHHVLNTSMWPICPNLRTCATTQSVHMNKLYVDTH